MIWLGTIVLAVNQAIGSNAEPPDNFTTGVNDRSH
jgi:hypothetical protein